MLLKNIWKKKKKKKLYLPDKENNNNEINEEGNEMKEKLFSGENDNDNENEEEHNDYKTNYQMLQDEQESNEKK